MLSSFDSEGVFIIILLAIIAFFLFFVAAILVVYAIGRMKLFNKMGEEGWKAWIPFYSGYTMVKVAGLDWYWTLLLYASVLSTVISSYVNATQSGYFLSILSMPLSLCTIAAHVAIAWNICAKFKKDTTFLVLFSIFFDIMALVLGFNKDMPDMSIPVDKDAYLNKVFNK